MCVVGCLEHRCCNSIIQQEESWGLTEGYSWIHVLDPLMDSLFAVLDWQARCIHSCALHCLHKHSTPTSASSLLLSYLVQQQLSQTELEDWSLTIYPRPGAWVCKTQQVPGETTSPFQLA